MNDNIFDKVFGDGDGQLTPNDIPAAAPKIVALVIDILALIAEYRVYQVGEKLTGSPLLALGFVAVSSVPFFLGQLSFLYPKANIFQQAISVIPVIMGLGVGAYYGLADFAMLQTIDTGYGLLRIDVNSLYILAVLALAGLIALGLIWLLCDDSISQRIKSSRVKGRADVLTEQMKIMSDLLTRRAELLTFERRLRHEFGDDAFRVISGQFAQDKSLPTLSATVAAPPEIKPTVDGTANPTSVNTAAPK